MNSELEDRLVQEFPEIFRDWRGDPQHTCMAWGIECPAAWEPAIRAACVTIAHEVRSVNERHPTLGFRVIADQIKEKFGTLRFYWHSECALWQHGDMPRDAAHEAAVDAAHGRIAGAIACAEQITALVCADCGAPNSANPRRPMWGNWCERCDAERTARNEQRTAEWNRRRAEREEADANNEKFRRNPNGA